MTYLFTSTPFKIVCQRPRSAEFIHKISFAISLSITSFMADHSTDKKHATPATVVGVVQESKTIKRIRLHVKDKSVTFKAGQWVDFFNPTVTIFTGYSMCSAPKLLEDGGILEIAVKVSDYPPTEWVHTKCKVGDEVQIKVSGTFFYHPVANANEEPSDLLLLAAGIGINPVYSIYRHYLDLDRDNELLTTPQGSLTLLYSAKKWDELVFKEDILQTAAQKAKVQVQLFTTSSSSCKHADHIQAVTNRRIRAEDVRNAMATLNMIRTNVYICGPPSFIDDMETFCLDFGLQQSQILYEKWW